MITEGAPPGSAPPRLPCVAGRPPRIVLLVYRDADTDSRVLKSAEVLRDAGAEVLVVGLAPHRSGLSPGDATTPRGLALHRTQDLDLARTFHHAARAWRWLRGRGSVDRRPRAAAAVGGRPAMTPPEDLAGAPSPVTAPPDTDGGLSSGARRLTKDLYMRAFRTARLVRYWAGAVGAARRFAPDVVQANDGNTLAPAMVLRALRGSRIVYDSHELWLHRNARPDRWLAPSVEQLTEGCGIRLADAVVAVSPSIVAWLQRHYHLTEPPVLVRNIPPWEGQLPDPAEGRLRQLAGLSPRDRIVSYCGGVTSGRGLEETIDALPLLADDVHLVMLGFGSADYIREVLARAEQRDVAHRVHLVGPVPGHDVPRTLADADVAIVYVRPIVLSYRFSLPNKLFESIHAGLPIVAADLPDTAALVRAHGVGAVFTAGTPAELAAAIQQVLTDPAPYRAAARRVAPGLDWSAEAARLIGAHSVAVRRCRA